MLAASSAIGTQPGGQLARAIRAQAGPQTHRALDREPGMLAVEQRTAPRRRRSNASLRSQTEPASRGSETDQPAREPNRAQIRVPPRLL